MPENTPAGVNIGDSVAARDDEGDMLTYSLTSGAANFDIVDTTGQLQTKVALDRERTSSYRVTVAVHDGKAGDGTASTAIDDTIRVTITTGNVDEPPTVTRATDLTVRENSTAVATYSASDPERATSTFTWSLTGNDAGAFTISERGALTFDPAPNFEARADRNRDNIYEVTVRANDGSKTGELDVEVTVEDVDESPRSAELPASQSRRPAAGSLAATAPPIPRGPMSPGRRSPARTHDTSRSTTSAERSASKTRPITKPAPTRSTGSPCARPTRATRLATCP